MEQVAAENPDVGDAPILGRDDALDALVDALRHATHLQCIVGPPGVGKTALGKEVGSRLVDLGEVEEVWWVRVGDGQSTAEVMAAVSRVAAVLEEVETVAAWSAALAKRAQNVGSVLLVLDACERSADAIRQLIPGLARLRDDLSVLCTSRLQFSHPALRSYPLEGLGTEAGAELLVRLAAQLGVELAPDDDAVRELVHRLDGLPLAIELVAGRTAVATPGELLERLDRRFGLLSAPVPGSSRSRSMWAATEWSWDELDETLRETLLALSVYDVAFTLEDAEALLPAGPPDAQVVMDRVQALVARSWMRRAPDSPSGRSRYEMLATFREFVRQKADVDEVQAARERMVVRLIDVAQGWVDLLDGPVEDRAIVELEHYVPALQGVRDRADVHSPAQRLHAADILDRVAAFRGHAARLEALDAVISSTRAYRGPERLLAVTARLTHLVLRGRVTEAEADADELFATPLPEDEKQRMYALFTIGTWYYALRRLDEAHNYFLQALQHATNRSDRARIAQIRIWMGMNASAYAERDYANREAHILRGEAHYLEAVGVLQDLGSSRLLASALLNLGNVYARLGRYAEMRRHQEVALGLTRKVGERFLEGGALSSLGFLAVQQGRHAEAQELLTDSLLIQHEVGRRDALAFVQTNLAVLNADRGRFDEAMHHLDEARKSARLPNMAWLERDILLWQGWIEWARGDVLEAAKILDACQRQLHAAGDLSRAWLARRSLALLRGEQIPDEEVHHGPWHRQDVHAIDALLRDGVAPADAMEQSAELRILSRAMAERTSADPGPGAATVPAPVGESIVLADDGSSFWRDDGEHVDLTRKRVLRQILACLVARRREEPGVPTPLDDIIAFTWPGQHFVGDSASNRVYVAISGLRQLGLDDVLTTRGGGYLLDPNLTRVLPP